MGEKKILRILLQRQRIRVRRLPVCTRQHHFPEQRVDIPSRCDELVGQMIEQFRVCRRSPLSTKILDRRTESLAEKECPHPIDENASCHASNTTIGLGSD